MDARDILERNSLARNLAATVVVVADGELHWLHTEASRDRHWIHAGAVLLNALHPAA
jgi:hypothetical protein